MKRFSRNVRPLRNALPALLAILAAGPAVVIAQPTDPRAVAFQASDGLMLSADYYEPPGSRLPAPFVILAHGHGQARASWAPLIEPLQEAGFGILALDLRGHGESVSEETRNRMLDRDPLVVADIHRDLRAAYDWLATQNALDRTRFAIVGADMGGAAALRYATLDRSVDAVVYLSPALQTMGIDTRSDMPKIRGRRILLVSGAQDGSSHNAVRELAKLTKGVRMLDCPGDAVGTALLESDPTLARKIAAFLSDGVGAPAKKPVFGKIESNIYHPQGSGWIAEIAATNLRVYSSAEEAEARGVRKAHNMGPDDRSNKGKPPARRRP